MSALSETTAPPVTPPWLVRISGVFADVTEEVLRRISVGPVKPLGSEYHLIRPATPDAVQHSEAALFVRWNLPVHHSWPCHPQKMEGFIEKAAQTLLRKFAASNPQAILVGQLSPGSAQGYYKSLASNLRGRVLQLFPPLRAPTAEDQDPEAATLFCLVGKEGLFCGVQSPKDCNGLHAGGSRFISQAEEDNISRAGAKIAEALHYLRMHRPPLPEGSSWLELGASPGGMTAELLARGHRITAVDRAPLDKRLQGQRGLTFVCADAAAFQPKPGHTYDALLCDMNGEASESMRQVVRLSEPLKPGGLVIFTLKMPLTDKVDALVELLRNTVSQAAAAGLHLLAKTHLTYNRHEFTLFFEKADAR